MMRYDYFSFRRTCLRSVFSFHACTCLVFHLDDALNHYPMYPSRRNARRPICLIVASLKPTNQKTSWCDCSCYSITSLVVTNTPLVLIL